MNEFQKNLYNRLQEEHQKDLQKAEAAEDTVEVLVHAWHARGMSEAMHMISTGVYSQGQSPVQDQDS